MHAQAFEHPLYVTRPTLPDFDHFVDEMRELWQSGIITNNGPRVQHLEQEVARILKVNAAPSFCNGTIALLIGLKALAIQGEVITTPFTFPATAHVLTWLGLKPVFCDIDPETLTIDPTKIEALITDKTTAILAVHVYGTPCAVEEIERIARKHDLAVIYDAAHAFGVEYKGRGIGSFGDLSMFSFHATKLFHTVEGGCLTFTDPALAEVALRLRNFGIIDETTVSLPGINGKMNELQAAVGLLNIPSLADNRAKRQALFEQYREQLSSLPGIRFCWSNDENTVPNYQYCVIRVEKELFGMSRDDLYEALKQHNIFTRKYFYPPCHLYPHYFDGRRLAVTEQISEEVLCLPIYPQLSSVDVELVTASIKHYCAAGVR